MLSVVVQLKLFFKKPLCLDQTFPPVEIQNFVKYEHREQQEPVN